MKCEANKLVRNSVVSFTVHSEFETKASEMSINSNVFRDLMRILASKQPISARELIAAMDQEGHDSVSSRRAIQLAFERGRIKLDSSMRVVMTERELEAA